MLQPLSFTSINGAELINPPSSTLYANGVIVIDRLGVQIPPPPVKLNAWLPHAREKSGKKYLFKVRKMSGKTRICQGKLTACDSLILDQKRFLF